MLRVWGLNWLTSSTLKNDNDDDDDDDDDDEYVFKEKCTKSRVDKKFLLIQLYIL
jgi:hypothetical protein